MVNEAAQGNSIYVTESLTQGTNFVLNPLLPDATKRSHIFKQTCNFQLQVCLSVCDLFVTTKH